MTLNTPPAHPHVTGVAVYPALFFFLIVYSRVLRDCTPRYVGPLVGPLVGQSPFYFFSVFEIFEHTAPAQMLQ